MSFNCDLVACLIVVSCWIYGAIFSQYEGMLITSSDLDDAQSSILKVLELHECWYISVDGIAKSKLPIGVLAECV